MLSVALLAPGALFLAAAVARQLQPIQFQPARTADRIVEAFSALPGPILVAVLVVAPLVALGLAGATLASSWREDASLRVDAWAWFGATRRLLRHGVFVICTLTLLVALFYVAAMTVHAIFD